MAAICQYCGETFSNPYCLGPHKRRCKSRFDLGVEDTDFSESAESSDQPQPQTSSDQPQPQTSSDQPQPQTCPGLWYLAQRQRKVGVETTPPQPPPGMYQYSAALSTDYTFLQKAWSDYTQKVADMCDPSFWETFEIVRQHPGSFALCM
jgi:hypothetical protein